MYMNCTSVCICLYLKKSDTSIYTFFLELHVSIVYPVYSPISRDNLNCNTLFSKSKVPARTSVSFTESLESRDPTESTLQPCRCLLASSLMTTWGMCCLTCTRMVLICQELFICCIKNGWSHVPGTEKFISTVMLDLKAIHCL